MSRMQEKIKHPPPGVYAGVDVSKRTLDFFLLPHGLTQTVSNDEKGCGELVELCQTNGADLVALEATGKYHRRLHQALHDAGIKTAVVNPFRSRQFADSMGKLAKTDGIDAQMLARFAERMTPKTTVPPTKAHQLLRELQTARRQIVREIGDLKRQLQTTEHDLADRQIRARLDLANEHRAALENEIQELVKSDPAMQAKFDILTSIPGIGKISAAILISDLAELGQVNARQIAALAGVAPMNWDSGIKTGNRMVRGGRQPVRNALYMCAVTCIRRSDSLGNTYQSLILRGKNPKVALTAVMRKLVILANTLIAEERKWQVRSPATVTSRPQLA